MKTRPGASSPIAVRTAFDEILERAFHDDVVLDAHQDSLLQQDLLDHLALALQRLHPAADLRERASERDVGLVLVAEAALQPAAHPRELRRVQREVLCLRHLDRDRVELAQPRAAAELAST